jgi:hypothetical protein
MPWMNQVEIEWAASQHHDCPNVRKGVRLLKRLMEAVNSQSDGWPYWKAPAQAAEKLTALLQSAGNLQCGTHGRISAADLRKAITPIRSMVIRQQRIQARYGNRGGRLRRHRAVAGCDQAGRRTVRLRGMVGQQVRSGPDLLSRKEQADAEH